MTADILRDQLSGQTIFFSEELHFHTHKKFTAHRIDDLTGYAVLSRRWKHLANRGFHYCQVVCFVCFFIETHTMTIIINPGG